MNVDKMAPEKLREGIRRQYPNYDGPEWRENKKTWKDPYDTFTVPTGMFIDDPSCNDKPVTMSATLLNGYGEVIGQISQWYMWVQKVKLKVFKKLYLNAFST